MTKKKKTEKTSTLKVQMVALDTLKLDSKNARVHSERNVDAIRASLEKFGQQKPIVVNKSGKILAGNGTYLAAKEMGWKEIGVVRTDLKGAEALAYALADNKTGLLADWDYEVLAERLRELNEELLPITGFEDFEIEPLLAAEWNPPPIEDLPAGSDASNAKPIIVTPDQRETIDRAVALIREREGDGEIKEGRCVELIAADFLASS